MNDILRYAHPFGRTVTVASLQQQFAGLHQWQDKHRQLILLSQQLPSLPETLKTHCIEVSGCQHRVWFAGICQPDGCFHFCADSDSRIVKGLLAILLTSVEGKTASQLLATDPLALFDTLQLRRQLSASRGQGLAALRERVCQCAATTASRF